jgi:hypothetical protein
VTIPADATRLGIDLNGDGKADNPLGDIASSILKTQSIDLQASATEAVKRGELLVASCGSSTPGCVRTGTGRWPSPATRRSTTAGCRRTPSSRPCSRPTCTGAFKPNPSSSEPDTISIGIGFTAVAAGFAARP